MSLPRFIDRAVDAGMPVLAQLGRTAIRERLERLSIGIGIEVRHADDPAARSAYLLAVNLAARLYPRLLLHGPADLIQLGVELATAINPQIDIAERGRVDAGWTWGHRTPRVGWVRASASGWNVAIDEGPLDAGPAQVPAALAAAAIGMGEVFRTIFAIELGPQGRTGRAPLGFNLLTLEAPAKAMPTLGPAPTFDRAYLVGAGAVGEAAALTLREAHAVGTLAGVDPQAIDLGNLQRYLLAFDRHVGESKVSVLAEQLAGSGVTVEQIPTAWGADERTQQPVDTVLAALDTISGRIELQASLPRRIYNAYTQPLDIGWSRHEGFGNEPCLACLYWPTGPRQNRHEIVGAALGQHPARVLRYMIVPGLTIGQPIPAQDLPADVEPELRARWGAIPIAHDIGDALFGDRDVLSSRTAASVNDLYHDMCAGALLPTVAGERHREVVVPLAHQSAFAGIMLATELLVARDPELAALRPSLPQARFDVFRPTPPRPLPLARRPECVCSDRFYMDEYHSRWPAPPAT